MAAEVELGPKMGQLIPRKLIEIQLSFVLTALREKIRHIHLKWPRRLLGLDLPQMQEILKQLERSLLLELQDAPRVLEPGWLEKQDEEQSKADVVDCTGTKAKAARRSPRKRPPAAQGRRKPAATT